MGLWGHATIRTCGGPPAHGGRRFHRFCETLETLETREVSQDRQGLGQGVGVGVGVTPSSMALPSTLTTSSFLSLVTPIFAVRCPETPS